MKRPNEQVQDHLHNKEEVSQSAPQGSVLGPILFWRWLYILRNKRSDVNRYRSAWLS